MNELNTAILLSYIYSIAYILYFEKLLLFLANINKF